MDDQKYDEIEKILLPFGFGLFQDFLNMWKIFDEKGFIYQDLLDFKAENKKRQDEFKAALDAKWKEDLARINAIWKEKAKHCPDCDKIMGLMPVNTNARNQVGGRYKSLWFCLDINCGYESYSRNTVVYWLKKLNINRSLNNAS